MAGSETPEAGAPPLAGLPLTDAVRAGDTARVREVLDGGADVAARDDDGWSALDWAAGRGDETVIRVLLDHGADPLATGREQRRPHDIALAAGHTGAARLLRAAADRAAPQDPADYAWRPYCRAYPLAELRRYPSWPDAPQLAENGGETAAAGEGDDRGGDDGGGIVFLHDDLTVTASMWPGEDVLFDAVTADWAQFCATELGFRVPDEMDLVPPGAP
jgi:ankyrin repeat protein